MAYCKHCGAYIPDGISACLACGYDENTSTVDSAAAAVAAKEKENEELRRKLEEQRKQQQEANRRWAEQEKTRRRQQEESRRWAEAEAERRRAEAQQQQTTRSVLHPVSNESSADSGKLFGALSYLSFLFVLPYIFTPQDEFAKYHAKQGMKLFVFSLIADAIGALTGFGWIITLLRLYLIYKGMSAALNGRKEPLPYIGNIGE